MASNLSPEIVSTIIAAVANQPDGATLAEVIAGFADPPERRTAQRWITTLTDAGVLQTVTGTKPHRYFTTETSAAYVARMAQGADTPPTRTAPPPFRGAIESAPASPAANPPRPADAVQTSPGLSAPPEPPATSSFETLLQEALFPIVAGVLPPGSAVAFLQNLAQQAVASAAQRQPFVQYGVIRLSRLTLDEARHAGLEPAQYELWRRQYPPAAEVGHVQTIQPPDVQPSAPEVGHDVQTHVQTAPAPAPHPAVGHVQPADVQPSAPEVGHDVQPPAVSATAEAVAGRAHPPGAPGIDPNGRAPDTPAADPHLTPAAEVGHVQTVQPRDVQPPTPEVGHDVQTPAVSATADAVAGRAHPPGAPGIDPSGRAPDTPAANPHPTPPAEVGHVQTIQPADVQPSAPEVGHDVQTPAVSATAEAVAGRAHPPGAPGIDPNGRAPDTPAANPHPTPAAEVGHVQPPDVQPPTPAVGHDVQTRVQTPPAPPAYPEVGHVQPADVQTPAVSATADAVAGRAHPPGAPGIDPSGRAPDTPAADPHLTPAAEVGHVQTVQPPDVQPSTPEVGHDVQPRPSLADSLTAAFAPWIDALLPGLNPTLRLAVLGAVVSLIGALLSSVGSSRWVSLGVPFLVIVAPLAATRWKRRRAGTRAPASPPNPAAPVPSSTPAPASSRPPSGRIRVVLAATALVLLAGIVGTLWYARIRQRPSIGAVDDHLVASLAPLPVRVAALTVTYGASDAGGSQLSYRAQLATTAALYRRLNTPDYLRAHAAFEWSAIEAANALLNGPDGLRIRAALAADTTPPPPSPTSATPPPSAPPPVRNSGIPAVSPSGFPPSLPPTPALQDLVLLTMQTPRGAQVSAEGTLLAARRNRAWTFAGEPVRVDRSVLAGEPRPGGAAVFAVDDPTDAARLASLIALHAAYAAKVQTAAAALSADRERRRAQQGDAFAQLLRAGTVFTGVATDPARGLGERVVLELTTSSATTRRLTALLRNGGGWSDVRPFQGDWTVGPDGDACTVTLRTGRADRIEGAGPFLGDAADATFVIQLRADGAGLVTPGNWQLRRVEPAEVPALKAELLRAVTPAIAATKPGTLYHGVATSRLRQTTEALLLRFNAQEADGALLQASLESATMRGGSRPLRGSIIGSTYRAGSNPIRLQSADRDRVPQADSASVLGINAGLTLALRVDGDRLVGQDERFTYAFEPGAPPAPPAATTPPPAQSGELNPPTSAPPARPVDRSGAAPVDRLAGYPSAPGVYVQTAGGWQPLPRNNARIIQSAAQSITAKLVGLNYEEDRLAGVTSTSSTTPIAALVFNGRDPVPLVPSHALLIAYVGELKPIAPEQLARYPQVAKYPLIEVAPLQTESDGTRRAPLVLIAPGFIGFGPTGLAITLAPARPTVASGTAGPGGAALPSSGESASAPVTLLRAVSPLAPGRYALFCGAESYEFSVVLSPDLRNP